ncbi:MAG: response regulator [Sulfurifustaceae bacterium]
MTEEKVNILLVDDQPARLLSYEAILAGLKQNLVRAQSGTEALAKLMEMEFAAILLDVSMPGMDGFETAAMIREHPRFTQTPIIFVTGVHVTDFDRLKGYEMGAVDYVYVPVIPVILRSKVRVLVELYKQRRELQRLNKNLAGANAELAQAHAALKAENTRELQKLNQTLEQANRELAQANVHLTAEIGERKRAEVALQEASRRKDEFLAILAHELRNPLSAIHNGVQLLNTTNLTERQFAWARDILGRQLRHLTRLIDDLLDVARITSGRIKLQREPIELSDVVAHAAETARPLIEARRHRFSITVPPEPMYVEGDMVRLTQVVDNLLTNAAKYTDEGGSIELTADIEMASVRQVVLRVRDNGVGIPPEMLNNVFELFAQVNSSLNRTQGGLGIGLALVRGLVELHGGTVQARSGGIGQGAEFIVRLPLLAAPAASPGDRANRRETTICSKRRILIIDDNVDSANGLAMWLEMAGHEVRLAHAGGAGLQAALEFAPDAVLLDIGLPDMNGYDVAKLLRQQPGFRKVPLIAVTGFGAESDRHQAATAGFDYHMVKPIDYDTLAKLLSRPSGTVSNAKMSTG